MSDYCFVGKEKYEKLIHMASNYTYLFFDKSLMICSLEKLKRPQR